MGHFTPGRHLLPRRTRARLGKGALVLGPVSAVYRIDGLAFGCGAPGGRLAKPSPGPGGQWPVLAPIVQSQATLAESRDRLRNPTTYTRMKLSTVVTNTMAPPASTCTGSPPNGI